ncbi:unnamed protein product [Euphydryas editha]|uniref:Uncharacterized protein n=1 Tax=Euphydryas editha TaxID=104508 RepID=A0AAU9TKU7_EUPED|nr:unnamed protein product [Euphydryas editha]
MCYRKVVSTFQYLVHKAQDMFQHLLLVLVVYAFITYIKLLVGPNIPKPLQGSINYKCNQRKRICRVNSAGIVCDYIFVNLQNKTNNIDIIYVLF